MADVGIEEQADTAVVGALTRARERVETEIKELSDKYSALDHFIFVDTELFSELPDEQRTLLRMQLSVMNTYLIILRRRLEIWKY